MDNGKNLIRIYDSLKVNADSSSVTLPPQSMRTFSVATMEILAQYHGLVNRFFKRICISKRVLIYGEKYAIMSDFIYFTL
jgi:hypothetical protein